ncbi:MAG: hypothetical protein ACOCPN_01680 [Desulfonatronovibrionaceae bacterium]
MPVKYSVLIFLLLGLTLLCACSSIKSGPDNSTEARLDEIILYRSPAMAASDPETFVRPVTHAPHQLKVLFFPFYLEPEKGGSFDTGRRVGHIFWRNWLNKEVFSSMPYHDMLEWPGRKKAGHLARSREADLYVLGHVNHYLNGGTQGTTSIGLTVNIYAAENDALIWSLQQSGRLENHGEMDYILVKRKTRMPESPEYVVVSSLASEMGRPVLQWTRAGTDK